MRTLVDRYIELAEKWGGLMARGDAASANDLYDQIRSLFGRIAAAGAAESLFAHSNHPNDSVSFFIASHLKEADPARAVPIYERLVTSQLPFVSVSAEFILDELLKS